MQTLEHAAKIAVRDCMGVSKNEDVLIITDSEKRKIGQALFEAAQEFGAEAFLMEMTPIPARPLTGN